MVPTIGLMVPAYIAMRCIEILAMPDERYSSGKAHGVINLVAILVLFLTGYLSLDCYCRARSEPSSTR